MKIFTEIITNCEPILRRSLIVIAIYILSAKMAISNSVSFIDSDIWWHLRAGKWIFENQKLPTIDPFSTLDGAEWIAYSWLYELLQYSLFSIFGLLAFVIYTLAVALLITWVLFSLLQRAGANISLILALTPLGMLAIGGLLQNRSYLMSILFFAMEMHVIYYAIKSNNVPRLFLLPFLFIMWANIHIQFIFGLFAYFFIMLDHFYVEMSSQKIENHNREKNYKKAWIGIGIASILATLITPYHVLIYSVLAKIVQQTDYYKFIDELRPVQFKGFNEWAFLFTALLATFVMGWERKIRPFLFILFGTAAMISFRSFRDVWFVVILGIIIIGNAFQTKRDKQTLKANKYLVIISLGISIFIMFRFYDVSNTELERIVKKNFPVQASGFLERNGLSGPILSSFEWGGYLIWRLPGCRVSMDSRTLPYGYERFLRRMNVLNGKGDWFNDPDLKSAKVILLNPDLPLSGVLRLDQRYKLVYEDKTSLVFIPNYQPNREDHIVIR